MLREKAFVKKFIVKFVSDPTFDNLKKDIKNQNIEKAYFDAHTLKGVCAVLDFIKLKELTEPVVTHIKQNKIDKDIWVMLENEYNLIIETIKGTNWM